MIAAHTHGHDGRIEVREHCLQVGGRCPNLKSISLTLKSRICSPRHATPGIASIRSPHTTRNRGGGCMAFTRSTSRRINRTSSRHSRIVPDADWSKSYVVLLYTFKLSLLTPPSYFSFALFLCVRFDESLFAASSFELLALSSSLSYGQRRSSACNGDGG
jgi:hypothetical protein